MDRGVLVSAAILGLALSGPGCSYALVQGPSRGVAAPEGGAEPGPARVACTTDSAAPTLDTVAALPMLLLTAVWALEAVNANECKFVCISTGAAIGISVGSAALATLFIASATTGNDRIADCRRAQQQPNWRLQRTGRYILDVNAIAEARAREASESR